MGIYVSCAVSLTTKFVHTYVCGQNSGRPVSTMILACTWGGTTTRTMGGEECQAAQGRGGNPTLLDTFLAGGVISTRMKTTTQQWQLALRGIVIGWQWHSGRGQVMAHGLLQRSTDDNERRTTTNNGDNQRWKKATTTMSNATINFAPTYQLCDEERQWQQMTMTTNNNIRRQRPMNTTNSDMKKIVNGA